MSAASPAASGIDPRGPRFGAAITSVLLLVTVGLALVTPLGSSAVERLVEPAALLQLVLVALFAWGAFAGIQRHPYGAVFRALVAPRLAPPSEREDPAAPSFAQGVGLLVTGVGLLLHLLGVPGAIAVSAAAAFVAAFLNAAFAYCLGCQLYVLLVRAGLVGRRTA